MKTKTILITLIAFLAVTALVFQSCKKDKEKTNQSPTCEITSPSNGQEITKGESVIISVEANDSDGTITEVRFAVDGVGKGSASNYPYNYTWGTNDESIGNHTIKATSFDNNGNNTSDEITIEITENSGGNGCEGQANLTYGGQTYEIVEIGNQCWMAENLNYEIANSWTYGDDPANGNIYGRLYNWEAAITACPTGWSLPSDDQWKQMEMALGMSQGEADDDLWRGTDESEKMKSTSGWNNNGNGTNSSGFNALPGSYRRTDGLFFPTIGDFGFWWSSTEHPGTRAWDRHLVFNDSQVFRFYHDKAHGFSVRCLKD